MEPSGKDGRGGGLALARDRSPDARRAIDDGLPSAQRASRRPRPHRHAVVSRRRRGAACIYATSRGCRDGRHAPAPSLSPRQNQAVHAVFDVREWRDLQLEKGQRRSHGETSRARIFGVA
jgi:hypothetical protein